MSEFYKYHGLGNDYIVIDPNQFSFKPIKNNIKLVCNRSYGLGSDGILLGPIEEDGCLKFRIFNPDGSEAEKSGNGIRIFALYTLDKGYVDAKKFFLRTKVGDMQIEVLDKKTNLIKVEIGGFSFLGNNVPTTIAQDEIIQKEVDFSQAKEIVNCVNIGNPHCVLIKDKISVDLAKNLGPIIENSSYFPNRINVQFVEIIDRYNIKIEIWERGAGYTLASGTSSVAAFVVASSLGLVHEKVNVHMQGGQVITEIKNKKLYLTGHVARVAEGNFANELKNKLQ